MNFEFRKNDRVKQKKRHGLEGICSEDFVGKIEYWSSKWSEDLVAMAWHSTRLPLGCYFFAFFLLVPLPSAEAATRWSDGMCSETSCKPNFSERLFEHLEVCEILTTLKEV